MTRIITLKSITVEFLEEFKEAVNSSTIDMRPIELHIADKAGGSTEIGLQIVDLIERSPVLVTGIVETGAASMSAIIFEACHKRLMRKQSYLHFHFAHIRVSLLIYYDQKLMERNCQSGIALQERLFAPVARRTGKSKVELIELFCLDRAIDAKESIHRNLADEMIE